MKKINYASMFTLRKDGRYQAAYTDSNGRHFIYDKDPTALYLKLKAAIEAINAPHVPTVDEVIDGWEREHREQITARTWKNYAPHVDYIRSKHGQLLFPELTALDVVNDLKEAKAKCYSVSVINSIRSLYSMIFDYAVIHGYATHNPVTSVKLPSGLKRGTRRAPTDEEMKIITSNIDAPFGLFAFMLLCTGLRRSEALALEWSDIDFKKKIIRITKSLDTTDSVHPKIKQPKTEAGIRVIPIIKPLMPHLKEAYKNRKSNLLFPAPPSNRAGNGGDVMSSNTYDGMWWRYCKHVGLWKDGKPTITAHNLRHGTATLMFESKVDEKTAQKILGHSRVEVTREIYTELRTEQEARSIKQFDQTMSKMMS